MPERRHTQFPLLHILLLSSLVRPIWAGPRFRVRKAQLPPKRSITKSLITKITFWLGLDRARIAGSESPSSQILFITSSFTFPCSQKLPSDSKLHVATPSKAELLLQASCMLPCCQILLVITSFMFSCSQRLYCYYRLSKTPTRAASKGPARCANPSALRVPMRIAL